MHKLSVGAPPRDGNFGKTSSFHFQIQQRLLYVCIELVGCDPLKVPHNFYLKWFLRFPSEFDFKAHLRKWFAPQTLVINTPLNVHARAKT